MSKISDQKDLLYLYGIIPTVELQKTEVPSIIGIDQKSTYVKVFKELAAIIAPVNPQSFSQIQIDLQLRELEWLKEKAFHHHEYISAIHQSFTILPMSFCTIFQNEENLERVLMEQYKAILEKLTCLKEKQEWNLKLFCSLDRVKSYVEGHNSAVIVLSEKLTTMPKGKQFLMKKKLEHLVAAEIEKELSRWWNEIMQHLQPSISDSLLRRNWGKEVTERNDDMLANCDFLIEKNKSQQFVATIKEIEKSFEAMGCSFQLTGPWPPYHYSKMAKET